MGSQANRVIKKFGGPYRLAELLDCAPSTIYRWTYPRPRGTGGLIPSSMLPEVLLAAELAGIKLTSKDLTPCE